MLILGDPRRFRKSYKKPKRPFEKERLAEELEYLGKYGLRNKREFWKSRTKLGNWRKLARHSRTLPKEESLELQTTLIKKLNRLGILGPGAEFEDLLLLNVEDVVKRRLQTMVYERGLSNSIHHARQLITHGHISVDGKKIDSPSYIVKKDEEEFISFAANSPFAKDKAEVKAEVKAKAKAGE